jgi:hypothetical protein
MGCREHVLLLYSSRERDGYHGLDHVGASRNRDRLEQVCKVEDARQIRARAGSDGSGTPGKSPQPHEPRARDGGPARINAAISYQLSCRAVFCELYF